MNTTPSAPGPHGGPSGDSPQQSHGFFTWLRGLGITRSDDRWFAGVAGGIAAKAGIDPLIVRGVFVVLALLGGPGLLLYLAAWLLLPNSVGSIHVEEIIRGRASAGVLTAAIILAAIVVLPALISMFANLGGGAPLFSVWGWGVWDVLDFPDWLRITMAWLVWVAVLVGAGFWLRSVLLRRGRDHQAQSPTHDPAPESPTQSFSEQADQWGRDFSERADAWGRDFSERADRWGNNVGRQADEWSARYAAHHDAHRLGAVQTLLTLACALLAAGAAALWVSSAAAAQAFSGSIGTGVTPAFIAGITAALTVLAVSLIIAGVRGRHTGWLGFFSVLGVAGLFALVTLPAGSTLQPIGTVEIDGRKASGTVVLAGTTTLDLSEVNERSQGGEIVLWQLAGQTNIVLPERAAADIDVRVFAGHISGSDAGDGVSPASGPFIGRSLSLEAPATTHKQPRTQHAEPANVTVYLLAGNVDFVDESLAQGRHIGAPGQPTGSATLTTAEPQHQEPKR